MTKRTTEKLARLKELAQQSGSNMFERCKLASEVLEDRDYLVRTFDGDEGKALEFIENEYFADVRGYITIGKLRQLYQEFPSESEWRKVDYDLAILESMYADNHGKDEKGLRGSRTSWKKIAETAKKRLGDVEKLREADREELRTSKSEIAELRARVAELEIQNAKLEGRIEELLRASEVAVSR